LKDFQAYWADNSSGMSRKFSCKECNAQLSILGYMQKGFGSEARTEKLFKTGFGFADTCVVARGRRYPIDMKI
jgi:hypothetical protein